MSEKKNDANSRLSVWHDLYVDLLGSLVPGLFTVILGGTAVALALSSLYTVVFQQALGTAELVVKAQDVIASVHWEIATVIVVSAYIIGAVFFRQDPKRPDAVSALRVWIYSDRQERLGLAVQATLDPPLGMFARPSRFRTRDIVNGQLFIQACADAANPCHRFFPLFTEEMQKELSQRASSGSTQALEGRFLKRLVQELNRILGDGSLMNKLAVAQPQLRTETAGRFALRPSGPALRTANRLLLEDAFPEYFRPAPDRLRLLYRLGARVPLGPLRRVLGLDFHRFLGLDAQFPYLHMKCYLAARGLNHLIDLVPWCPRLAETHGFRTKMFVNILKVRLLARFPWMSRDIIRNEAHVRLATSVWHAVTTLLKLSAVVIVLVLTVGWTFPGSTMARTLFLPVSVALLLLVFCAGMRLHLNKCIHYMRVREVIYVLETAHLAKIGNVSDKDLFDDLLPKTTTQHDCLTCPHYKSPMRNPVLASMSLKPARPEKEANPATN